MARVLEKLLHVNSRIAKCSTRFSLGHLHRIDQRRFGVHHTHAAPTAAAGGLDDHGIPHGLGDATNLGRVIRQFPLRAWHTWNSGFDHGLLGRDLVTHDADRLGRGANELKTAFLDPLGKVCVFAQEAIACVNGLGVCDFSGRNDGRHIQVTQGRGCRANAHGFVGQFHVFGFSVCFRIHHHRLHTHFATSALDA